MPATEQLECPFILTSASPSVSIDDLMDAKWKFDPELHEHFCGASRFPTYTIGNDNTTISAQTSDNQGHTKYIKGQSVTDITIKFRVPVTAADIGVSGPTLTRDTKIYGFKISTARVIDAVEVGNSGSSKEVAKFDLNFRAQRVAGVDPTLTFLTS